MEKINKNGYSIFKFQASEASWNVDFLRESMII